MSESDSFINEVSEEVRRDRLYGYVRRYGWIAALAVVALVGGAAFNEVRKAQNAAAAEAVGDGLLTALQADDPEARIAALQGIEVSGSAAIAPRFFAAAELARDGQTEAAVAAYAALTGDADLAPVYRDLATFKSLVLQSDTAAPEMVRQGFEALAAPGGSFRLLAQEQLAVLDASAGDNAAAIARLQSVLADTEVGPGLRRRATQLIVALGGTPLPQ